MNATHPGPWKLHENNATYVAYRDVTGEHPERTVTESLQIHDANGRLVCKIESQFPGPVDERERTLGALLLTVPALVTALESSETQIMECIEEDNPRNWYENALATLATIRAVLKEAKPDA